METVPGEDLATALSEVARFLHSEHDEQSTLETIAAAAVDTVPGARHAGLMVVRRHREIETRAATDDVVRDVDQAQLDTGQGPCLEAVYQRKTVRLGDLTREKRWPVFAERAGGLGIRSMLSFQLFVEDDSLGALNLYAPEPQAFDDDSEHIGALFAAHAAIALTGVRQQEQCGDATQVRDLIGQAKGILMERYQITADLAFGLLVQVSRGTGTKMVDVARHLADTGDLRQ
ncbi:GAF and ANTAR domain-containing protein [Actinoplanes siamensis]|uniref:ANTAR domain-containing protein n=1 Tax=Actinoplanes siamensis TaxID=1223317 RepID=A0A919N5X1_9ACTN|nr:GAF and ANTAR domain-containing protein [Actinoplanes siamensis]GIF04968.1 hypothetical protein Asi03nite_25060 [Actinoplanes siamensis]